jgi:hypothetical protein
MEITKTDFVRPAFVFQLGTSLDISGSPSWKTIATIELLRAHEERGVFRVDDARVLVPEGPELHVWCAFGEQVNSVSLTVAELRGSRTIQRATLGANFLHSGTFGFALDDARHVQIYVADLGRERRKPREESRR